MLPAKPRRRSISAAAKPAAPPPTMTMRSFAAGLARRGRCLLVVDEDLAVAFFDLPAGQRAQGGRGHGFTRLQAEMRMMPRTADGLAHEQAVGERPVIMRAMGRKREQLATLAHEQYLVVADVAGQHGSCREIGSRDAG